MFPSVQTSREWGGKFSRTLGWEWGREERLPGLFVGEWGRVESLLGLLVGDWSADLQLRGGGEGGRSSWPWDKGGGLGPQFGLKIKGGGPLLDPPLDRVEILPWLWVEGGVWFAFNPLHHPRRYNFKNISRPGGVMTSHSTRVTSWSQNGRQLGFLYFQKRAKRSYCILGMDLHVNYSVTKRNKNNNTYTLARMHLGQSL